MVGARQAGIARGCAVPELLRVAPGWRRGAGSAGSCAGRLPRPRVGRTAAACAGKGVWGRDRSSVCVGAPCQPAEDPRRAHPCVQHWEASIEASVTVRDFLNTAQERDLRRVPSSCVRLCPGAARFVMLLLRWGAAAEGLSQGQRARPAGLCPSIIELHASVFCSGCSSAHLCSRLLSGWLGPWGANRGSPALVEEHRQERERFPWKPLDAQQQVLTAAM